MDFVWILFECDSNLNSKFKFELCPSDLSAQLARLPPKHTAATTYMWAPLVSTSAPCSSSPFPVRALPNGDGRCAVPRPPMTVAFCRLGARGWPPRPLALHPHRPCALTNPSAAYKIQSSNLIPVGRRPLGKIFPNPSCHQRKKWKGRKRATSAGVAVPEPSVRGPWRRHQRASPS
jgi:hypothetical protein